MLNVITLKCPNCGSNLQINSEMSTFACGYCGASQMVERSGGTVCLKLLTDAISRVQVGTDKTASELAIRRLNEELYNVQTKLQQFDIWAAWRIRAIKSNSNVWLTVTGVGAFIIGLILTTQSGLLFILMEILWFGLAYYLWGIRVKSLTEQKRTNNEHRQGYINTISDYQRQIAHHQSIVRH